MYNRQAASEPADAKTPTSGEPHSAATQETNTVSLHVTQTTSSIQNNTTSDLPEVFAEIWKDGMKVGTVYANGEAELPNTPGGTISGGSGTTFAYIRAQEISQQVGGEVHYVNITALQVAQTRAQLHATYAR